MGASAKGSHLIIFYDATCGLCDELVRFVIARDHADRLRFGRLQSELANRTLASYETDQQSGTTMYVVTSNPDSLLCRSEAVIAILRELGGKWLLFARILRAVPKFLRDWGYTLVARNRYRIFGKREQCMLPSEYVRHKFLDFK